MEYKTQELGSYGCNAMSLRDGVFNNNTQIIWRNINNGFFGTVEFELGNF